jgi:hypothetical protein
MRGDLERLIKEGDRLFLRMQLDLHMNELVKKADKKTKEEITKDFPEFNRGYQRWYSEAVAMISVLLPGRVDDFRAYYQLPRKPKELDYSTYTISDYLKGTTVTRTRGFETTTLVGPKAAQTPMQQQVEIVRAASARFESSLFDIKAMAQADLFDNELDAAAELNKHGFARGAGAIAGVVLAGHLATVSNNDLIAGVRKISKTVS